MTEETKKQQKTWRHTSKQSKARVDKITAKTKGKKKLMLECLDKQLGVITAACKMAGISRETHYRWMTEDTKYERSVKTMPDRALDFAEAQLFRNMKKGNAASQIFYLKTKGKKRGYIERQEVEHVGDGVQKFVLVDIDKPEDVAKLKD